MCNSKCSASQNEGTVILFLSPIKVEPLLQHFPLAGVQLVIFLKDYKIFCFIRAPEKKINPKF